MVVIETLENKEVDKKVFLCEEIIKSLTDLSFVAKKNDLPKIDLLKELVHYFQCIDLEIFESLDYVQNWDSIIKDIYCMTKFYLECYNKLVSGGKK